MLGRGTRSPQDRRNKRAAIKKAALSSKLSLVSGVTQSSSGSSGSGSTVTQESISRSRTKASKGIVSSKGKKQKPTAKGTAAKQSDSPRKGKGAIDVFAFLDKDQSRASLVQKQSNKPPVDIRDASKYPLHDDSDGESDPRSFHSDSGISIDDTSSEQSCSKINKVFGTRLGTVEEEPVSGYFRPSYAEHRHHPKLQPIPQDIDEEHPECYYRTDDVRNEPDIASASGSEETSGLAEEPTSSGYDLLASRLCSSQEPSEDSLPPLYRRFERLNHRILLQLQDEIAEMEEDLQFMDQVDAHERAAHRGQAAPASRRLDWQWRGNELHGRRLEMLGRIYLKVEQYNQALASFQRVASSTSPAVITDVEKYRKWMAENKPIAEAEATYLDKENDLLSLTQLKSNTTENPISSNPPTPLMIAIISVTAIPILLFRIIPGLISRITVILLFVSSIACMSKPQAPGSFFNGRESRHFLFVYLGVLVLAALVI